jgi:hypothetical protein
VARARCESGVECERAIERGEACGGGWGSSGVYIRAGGGPGRRQRVVTSGG